ncbi:LysR family transcriptional regulator [Caenispirillum bisanense]|uniref:DNA-binding transcriptional regulator, LysR family n=1 Tax=Caenispirillum bisanense TaxID=414052 RepID=A0A286G999_9PROT|nr:LysR family transcriptional regulator [Caenispirillum bisanense]SOD92078.1 DNA-binding transcriptional regulator, LysR family [Caenispirillum bisanense]
MEIPFDLPALRLVLAVGEAGSLSGAAERLHTVQSNVTTRLRRLEDALGCRLFERHARGVVPTEAGRRLAAYAERILALAEEAGAALRAEAAAPPPLRLGAMETTAAVRLPPLLAALTQAMPDLTVTVETGPTDALVEQVLAGRLDCAFVGGPVDHAALVARPAFVETLVLVTPRRPAAGAAATLVAFRAGCSYRARAERLLRETGRLPYRVLELGTLDGILGCVAAGIGMAVVPAATAARADAAAVRVEALPDPLARTETLLLTRRDAAPHAGVAALAGHIPPST